MNISPEKVMGCFLGMAIGDAMGRAVNGLKPEAIRQIFGTIEDYKDIRNIIGKGIKHYRMQGLYGDPTLSALAVCEGVLTNIKKFVEETTINFRRLFVFSSKISFLYYYFTMVRLLDFASTSRL